MEFDTDGNSIYIVKSGDKNQIILMTYQVDDTSLVTDQPSHPEPRRRAGSGRNAARYGP